MKNLNLKGLLKVVLLFALCLGATYVSKAMGMTNGNVQQAIVTPVALPVLNQLAESEMIKQFRHDNTWLGALTSKNQWVNNNIIKIPKRGDAPSVLINNTIYPIAASKRDDTHVILSLNKYDTENTTVSVDEIYALPYEKLNDVQEQHRETLEDNTGRHAIHSIAPQANSATTPIISCTGVDDGTGRLRLTSKDVIAAKKAQDKLKVSKDGRILVLCPEHVADLLLEDRTFLVQYQNAIDGLIAKSYYGFMIYESTYNPTYTALGVKVAYGAVDGPKVGSIIMHNKTCFKSIGTLQRFARLAEMDPENRKNTVGFQLYFIGIAIRDEGVGAIVG